MFIVGCLHLLVSELMFQPQFACNRGTCKFSKRNKFFKNILQLEIFKSLLAQIHNVRFKRNILVSFCGITFRCDSFFKFIAFFKKVIVTTFKSAFIFLRTD